MTNLYYNFDTPFVAGQKVRAGPLNLQFLAIEAAFDLMPTSGSAITTGKTTYAGSTAGSGNAFTVTMPNTRGSNVDGDEVVFKANRSNTGAATLNVDGIGAVPIRKADGEALIAGDITSGLIYEVRYDAANTRFQLVSPALSDAISAASSASAAAASAAAAAASASAASTSASAAASSAAAAAASAASITLPLPITSGGTGATSAANAFTALKQAASELATGVVEKATIAEVRSAAADKYLAADHIETASAAVALTDAATVAVDWDAGIYFTLTLTANRILGNPTNGQPGTWRTVRVQGNNTTDRALTFDNQYLNVLPTLVDIDSGQPYLLTIFCHTASAFYVFAQKAGNF